MARPEEIYTALAKLAPVELAESWDNVGLLVDTGMDVTSVLVTLDITDEVVREAELSGCQLVVSHHPVIFAPLKRLSRRDVAFRLVKKNISAICMHTNLDAAEGGVNDVLAGLFGVRDAQPFADGCGRIGAVNELTVPQLAEQARRVLGAHVKYCDTGRSVRRLAVISGAGGSMFEQAAALGADCLLTGEASHHAALDAKRFGMSLIAAGHYATEQPVVPVLAQRLQKQFPQLRVVCSRRGKDPFTYL